MRQFLFILSLLACLPQGLCFPSSDTVKLYYDIAISDITQQNKHKIDSLIYSDIIAPGKKLGIIGYCDYLGSEENNQRLSENRAKKIQTYLLSLGIRQQDIEIVMGKGEISRSDIKSRLGYATDRRVDLILGGFKSPPKKSIIDISQLKKNQTIRLDNIFFYPGKHKIRDESLKELQKLYTVMKENPALKIRVEGHICCTTYGTSDGYDYDTGEFTLSVNRAKEIYNYLRIRKIDTTRIEYKGFGKTKPMVNPELNEEDENKNRRVEIRVLDN